MLAMRDLVVRVFPRRSPSLEVRTVSRRRLLATSRGRISSLLIGPPGCRARS